MIYTTGTIAINGNTVTGTGTNFSAPLSLIRVGCTLIAVGNQVQIFTITEIKSGTELSVTPAANPAIPAGTKFSILLSDSISVDGLAQDVAETLRFYQEKEDEISSAIDGSNIGLGPEPRDCTDISGNPSSYVGFLRIKETTKGFPSVAAGESFLSGFICQRDTSPSYTGVFVGWATRSLYTYTWIASSGPNWTRHARKDEVDRLLQTGGSSKETQLFDGERKNYLFVNNTGWGAYSTAGSLKLGVMYGGTGSGNAEDARTNLGIGPSNSPQFVNVALKRATDVTTGWVAGGIFHSTLAGTTGTERVYGAMYPETHLTEPDQLTMHLRTGGESKYASLTANGEFIADSFKAKNAQQTRRNLNIPTIGGGELTIIEAPEGVENGKYYPIIIDASYYSAYLTGYQIDIQTRSALSTDPMNCNSFSGYVRTGGWHDKKNSGYGYYVSHTANEVALQSICAPGTNKEHLLFVFVEARAFPVTMRLPVGVTATAPTSQVIYNEGEPSEMIVPWGASDPLTSYKNLTTMFDFRMARCGFYSATTEGAYYSCTGDRAILFNGINLSKEVSLTMPKLTINGMVKSSDNYVVSEISGRFIRHVVHSSTTANAHVVTWGSSAEPLNYEVKVVGDDSLETGLKTLFTAKYLSDGSATLAVEGNITCTSVTQSSDRDLKDNIQVIGDATEAIRKMNGYTYTLKENGLPYAGVIAQEVMEALPEAVGSFTHYGKELQGPTIDGNELREETRYLNVDYAAVTGLLVQVARETDNRVTELEEENASLRANIAVMDERITKLEALVRQLTGSEK